jgi:hypothetical protein
VVDYDSASEKAPKTILDAEHGCPAGQEQKVFICLFALIEYNSELI